MTQRLFVALALLVSSASFASVSDVSWYEAPEELRLKVGNVFPQAVLFDSEGVAWNTAEFRGKPTVVTFFSAYCGPCIKEIPSLNQFLEEHTGIRVVAISSDDVEESRQVKERHGLKWPILANAGAKLDEWGVQSFPSFVLVSSEGVIVSATYGNRLSGTAEMGYVSAAGISAWIALVLPQT